LILGNQVTFFYHGEFAASKEKKLIIPQMEKKDIK
jgi:hypothetical protein